MAQEDEYGESMIQVLELLWGSGYMAPGGEQNVLNLFKGFHLKGKKILDLGCGLGGPACFLAESHGARVTGIDIESNLIRLSKERAAYKGVEDKANFILVEPGNLNFPNEEFDYVMSIGGLTQIEDKGQTYKEILRVLKNGGCFTSYEWLKSPAEISQDMLYFFEVEGLTYSLQSIEEQRKALGEMGFEQIEQTNASTWYKKKAREEYENIQGALNKKVIEIMGQAKTEHYIEDWRSMLVVLEKDELLSCYTKAFKLS
ncbi:MAG: methyltransferase domain-containing protein [Flavobacteriales bacterium]|nr:methyltransferase domain-containing protein [Flavobacteriales bacterium]